MNIFLLFPTVMGGMWGLYGSLQDVPTDISKVQEIRIHLPAASDDEGWIFTFGPGGQVVGSYEKQLHGRKLSVYLPLDSIDFEQMFHNCRKNIIVLEDSSKMAEYFRSRAAVGFMVDRLEDLPFGFLKEDSFLRDFFIKHRDS